MIRLALPLALLWVGCAAAAQQDAIIISPLDELEERAEDGGFGAPLQLRDEEFQTFEQELRVTAAEAGFVRVLDKTTGRVETLELQTGQTLASGRLQVAMIECRYPEENPSSDAFVQVRISEQGRPGLLYDGWMIASSPALAALDHHRYDVWAIRCRLPGGVQTPEVQAGLQSPRPPARP
ncbi:DUF2155 domain-containing protein [Dinoroseobacter sp. S124A]|uniref:DUF2155 domain-containing protein n=1 Tax=Dinoroseobacter sp. S124A TaxID=3415128 RepID=UPI003C7C414D